MSKTITVRLKKAGNRLKTFSLTDDLGNTIDDNITKNQLISGVTYSVADTVRVLILSSTNSICCNKSWNLPITELSKVEIAAIKFESVNTASLWRHLTDPTIYNKYYGCTMPYIIEYPFAYEYQDETVQNVQDYSKVYTYLPSNGVFEDSQKIETDDKYFNKAILYNGQQSSGYLELVAKPVNNLSQYLTYPKFNTDSKTIIFTKSDSFYQYNTFWAIQKLKTIPLFLTSCESMSIDKEVNQSNMDYGKKSFQKAPLKAKDLKVRHILDNSSTTHIVSQFIITPSQISHK